MLIVIVVVYVSQEETDPAPFVKLYVINIIYLYK